MPGLVQVLVEVLRFQGLVDEDVRLPDGGAGEVVRAERGAVVHGGPVVREREPVVAELEEWRDELFVGPFCLVHDRRLQSRVPLRRREELPQGGISRLLACQWRGIVEQQRQLIEERLGEDPLRFGPA